MGIVATLAVRVTANTSDFEKQLGKLEGQWKRTGAKLQSIGSSLTTAVTLPLLGISAAALKVSMDFETAMTKTVTLAGETRASMDGLKSSVIELSKQTGIGPVDLANALVAIESNGLKGKDAMDVLAASAKGSAIGMGSAVDIGRALTAVMNAYGASGLTASQAADQFHQTVLLGGADASTLAGEFGRVIGLAANLGVTFAETGAFIATYTQLGLSASEATTALSGILNTILNPSKEARDALKGLGMSADDLRRSVAEQGLGATLTSLIAKLKGNEDATGALFGNVRALAGVMGTAGVQADRYKSNLEAISNTTGSLNAAFKVWEGTTAATWSKFTAGAQAALIVIGDQLAPAFSRVLQAALPLLDVVVALANWFSQLPQPVQTVALALTGVAAAAGPVAYVFGTMFTAGSSLLGLLKLIPGASAVAGSGWALIANPITGVIALIGGLIYAMKQLTGSWTSAFSILMPPIGFLMSAWQGVADKIRYVRALMPGGSSMPAAPTGPGLSINAPLGPAMDINDAMALLEQQTQKTTRAFGNFGRDGAAAVNNVGKSVKQLLESSRAIPTSMLAALTAPDTGDSTLGGFMSHLSLLPSNSGFQGLATQMGMSGAPDVQSVNVTGQIAEATAYAHEQMAASAKETVDGIRKAFQYFTGSLSGGMAALLGGVMNILEKGAAKGGFLQKLLGGKAGAMIGTGLDIGMSAFGGGFGMGEQFGKGKGALGGAATGALSGFMVGGPIGAAIGGIAGLLGGLFGGGKKKKQERAAMADTRGKLLEDFGGMENLQKQAQLAGVSIDLLFSTTKPEVFKAELEKVGDAIKVMQERIKSTISEVDDVMSKGGIITADLWKKILPDAGADEIKAKLKEVFVTSVNQAADGFNKIATNFELLKRPISEIGVLAQAAFGGLLTAGASLPEAIAAIEPGLAHLREIMKPGENAGGPLGELLNWQGIIEKNKGLFELLAGTQSMLTGLANSGGGLLTQQTFSALGATISQAFGQLTAHGVAAATAFQMMQPQLQALWQLEKDRGLTLDANTQKMLDQAVQQGIVGPQMESVEQKMLDVMLAIAKVLGADIPEALAGLPAVTGAAVDAISPKFQALKDQASGVFNGIPHSIDIDMRLHGSLPPGGLAAALGVGGGTGSHSPTSTDYYRTRIPAMAAGGIVSRPTTILAGEAGPEAIVPLDDFVPANAGVVVNINGDVYGEVTEEFAIALARKIQRGGRTATAWRGTH